MPKGENINWHEDAIHKHEKIVSLGNMELNRLDKTSSKNTWYDGWSDTSNLNKTILRTEETYLFYILFSVGVLPLHLSSNKIYSLTFLR